MAKRNAELGLGRGLNALLGDPELPAQGEGSVTLPISQVGFAHLLGYLLLSQAVIFHQGAVAPGPSSP